MAGLQVGGGLLGVLPVWVWGQQFQSPMFLGTQPPYAMKELITVSMFCIIIIVGQIMSKHTISAIQNSIKWKVLFLVLLSITNN